MDNKPATNSSRSSLVRLWPWLVVLAVILSADIIRVRLLAVPLTRDEGEYAYAGQLILQGVPPYELAYNMKLPGTYLAYALGMGVFGQTIVGIHLTLLLVNSLTTVFVFLLGRRLSGNVAAVVTCVSYAVMTLSPAVAGLATDADHFVVLFAVPAILLLLKANETNGWKTFFGSGLLFGLAFLMKQQGICFGLFGFVLLVWAAARSHELLSGRFAGKMMTFGTGLVLPYALTCLWLAITGVFGLDGGLRPRL
jgi:4-amino-4-deoxy-L-arabinose transferase-like glycosyltransferase